MTDNTEITNYTSNRVEVCVTEDGQKLTGNSRDVLDFLGMSDQDSLANIVLGVYLAMKVGNLNELELDCYGLGTHNLDEEPVTVDINPDRLIVQLNGRE